MPRWKRFWQGYMDGARRAGVRLRTTPWFAEQVEAAFPDVRYLRYRTGVEIGEAVARAVREFNEAHAPTQTASPAATCLRAIEEHLKVSRADHRSPRTSSDGSLYIIVRRLGTSGERGPLWALMRGRRYRTREAAEKAFARLEEAWDRAAEEGRMHPSWRGQFRREHAIVEVREGESFADAIKRHLDGAYMGLSMR